MLYQTSLFDYKLSKQKTESKNLKILLWNIQNPSFERAGVQLDWLITLNCDVLILTEVKYSKGFIRIINQLQMLDYKTIYTKTDSYFTLIALRNIDYHRTEIYLGPLCQRVASVEIEILRVKFNLIGVYVPTNSSQAEKIISKQTFQDNFILELTKIIHKENNLNFIIGGDFNVLDPFHIPHYPQYEKWNYFYEFFEKIGLIEIFKCFNPNKLDYTWQRNGRPQRLDYFFISKNIKNSILECNYIHEPRFKNISDHSAMVLTLSKDKKILLT